MLPCPNCAVIPTECLLRWWPCARTCFQAWSAINRQAALSALLIFVHLWKHRAVVAMRASSTVRFRAESETVDLGSYHAWLWGIPAQRI